MKKLDYEYKAVHLLNEGGQQLKDDFAAKNPSKELPCLQIDGMNLAQSMAIISYLEETGDGGEQIFPKDPKLRYMTRRLCDIIGTGIQPIQNLRVLKYNMAKVEGKEEKTKVKLEWGKYWIDLGVHTEVELENESDKKPDHLKAPSLRKWVAQNLLSKHFYAYTQFLKIHFCMHFR